ncbi:hypothetical protein [Ascidiimonas aurantiaca]|uniref:hypothetical protein n=1 Tax=Ascidiimonas aurantiaca TaxID=1685432 RepID=UPI0030ED3002
MKSLHTKKLNRQQLRSIMAGLGVCPYEGQACTPGEPFNCIPAEAFFCINGVWTQCSYGNDECF